MSNSISKDFRFFSLLQFALPTMVMMVFMSLYTIVDGIFLSRLVGSNALSALNIVFPIINILIAIGVMLGTGGSAVIAKKLGEGKEDEARKDFTFLIVVGAVGGLFMMAVGTIFLEGLCKVLGSTEILMADCKTYLQISLFFAPACMLQLLFQTFFVTAGRPNIGLIMTILGGVINIIMDYVLMGPAQMGIAGAALATGLGQLVPSVIGLFYFSLSRHSLFFAMPKADFKMLLQSCLNGSSEMVSNLSSAMITYLFNIIMLRLIGEDGVAAITIVLYGQFLFNALYLGFSMGVAPVISFNYGSGNQRLLQKVYGICLKFVPVSSLIVALLALVFTPAIVGIFTPKGRGIYEIAVHGFFLFSFNYFLAGMNIFASSMFTALSNGKISAIISFARTFIFIVLSIISLPFVLGVNGVWISVPVAEFLTLFLSCFYLIRYKKVYGYAPPFRKKLEEDSIF